MFFLVSIVLRRMLLHLSSVGGAFDGLTSAELNSSLNVLYPCSTREYRYASYPLSSYTIYYLLLGAVVISCPSLPIIKKSCEFFPGYVSTYSTWRGANEVYNVCMSWNVTLGLFTLQNKITLSLDVFDLMCFIQ